MEKLNHIPYILKSADRNVGKIKKVKNNSNKSLAL
jgi:hypothetical protein